MRRSFVPSKLTGSAASFPINGKRPVHGRIRRSAGRWKNCCGSCRQRVSVWEDRQDQKFGPLRRASRRRCRILKLNGISLHSYRYAVGGSGAILRRNPERCGAENALGIIHGRSTRHMRRAGSKCARRLDDYETGSSIKFAGQFFTVPMEEVPDRAKPINGRGALSLAAN